jgi:predicted ATP-grasp superfamily ATP-dependent carboligase
MDNSIAVVLGMGPTALALVRALGRKSVTVCGIGLSNYEVALSSKYCTPIGIADPRYNPDKMLDLLLCFGKKHSKNRKLVLYPTGDECVAFIGENCKILSQHYCFSRLNPVIVELFLNKSRFHAACLEHSMPTSATFLVESANELSHLSKNIRYPCIAKPKYYHKWAMKHGLVKGIVCWNANELVDFGRRFADDISNFIIQEVINGTETDIFVFAAYFDRHSQPHGVFVGQKIRQYPIGFGTTTMMKTANVPKLEKLSINFMQNVGYQGLCDIEYKYNRRTQSFCIIEINPRLGRWYGIVEAAGHDTIYYSYLDLTDQPIPYVSVKSKNVTWAFTPRDLLSIIKNREWGLAKTLRSYYGPKTWCIWDSDDVIPFFAYPVEIVTKGLRAAINRLHLSCDK